MIVSQGLEIISDTRLNFDTRGIKLIMIDKTIIHLLRNTTQFTYRTNRFQMLNCPWSVRKWKVHNRLAHC